MNGERETNWEVFANEKLAASPLQSLFDLACLHSALGLPSYLVNKKLWILTKEPLYVDESEAFAKKTLSRPDFVSFCATILPKTKNSPAKAKLEVGLHTKTH